MTFEKPSPENELNEYGPIKVASIVRVVLLTAVMFAVLPWMVRHFVTKYEPDSVQVMNHIFAVRTWVLELGSFAVAWLMAPAWRKWRLGSTGALGLVAALVVLMPTWIFVLGNKQFGAWDYSILIDTGWRQILGQHPYTSFITPNPPAFNLGLYAAFRLFGVSWNAQLIAISLFCSTTFLWMYWLLRRLAVGAGASVLLAFTVEAMTTLTVCFWWYNDTTAVTGVVFLLSTIACARREPEPDVALWASYAVSLGMLGLMKPNIAGLLIVSCLALLLIAARQKVKALAATAVGTALALSVLAAAHVSIPAMLASYRGAAQERAISHFGLSGYSKPQLVLFLVWALLLATPLYFVWPRLINAWRERAWSRVAWILLLVPAFPVALYGMATNGEVKESEAAVLILSCGLVVLGLGWSNALMKRFYVAMIAVALASSLYYGLSRQRVFGILNHGFYEAFGGTAVNFDDGFFHGLHSSARMDVVQHEVNAVLAGAPGTVFFGPRMEFEYADHKLPSPLGWPVYYQPGTSFARRDLHKLTQSWEAQHYQTLIFLKDDMTFYPDDLIADITGQYDRVPGYTQVTVYRRK